MFPDTKPFVRDHTPNPPQEIVKRLRTLLAPLALVVGLVLAASALSARDERPLTGAYVCAAIFVALLLIPKRWRTTPVAAPTASATAPRPPAAGSAASFNAPASSAPDASGPRPRILLLNASLAGREGNSARLLAALASHLAPHAELLRATLAGPGPGSAESTDFTNLQPALRAADAFVFATGTHWDSWSSPLQKFLEDATPAEATALWLGKPAAVLVTEHSTGGKGVLSRLQGVLVTLGCSIPPLSGLVLSQAAQRARAADSNSEDYWSPEDLAVVAHNLLAAARQPRADWRAWPVDRSNYTHTWIDTAK
jgi:NAD(P)H-dependent FMN reductase